MISVLRRTRRRLSAVLVAAVVGVSLLFAAPAQAYEVPSFDVPDASQAPLPYVSRAVDASGVLELWMTGGPATRKAAGLAVAGGDAAIQVFLDGGQDAALAADRKQLVTELTESGTEHVRSSATKMLATGDPEKIDEFLSHGWERAWQTDLRIAATNFLHYGVPSVQKAASTSLDTSEEAVEAFVLNGWKTTVAANDRVEVTWLTDSKSPSVTLGAQAALDANDSEVLADFLRYGQQVAGARDAETAAIAKLLEQVKADVAGNPVGAATVAGRAHAAVGEARNIAANARTEDRTRLEADRILLTSHAGSGAAREGVVLARQKPMREAFAAAAKELPGLLATLAGADVEDHMAEARQLTRSLTLVERPTVQKAARAALLGGDEAVKDFIATGLDDAQDAGSAEFVADRQRTYQALGTGGPNVQKAASAVLKSTNHADVRYFLKYGMEMARDLDNRVYAYQTLDSGGPEVRAAADVALSGSRADVQNYVAVGQKAAADRDEAAAAHVARVDAAIAELAGIADRATLDAGRAAEAAKAAEAARAAEAAQSAEAGPQAAAGTSSSTNAAPFFQPSRGSAPIIMPWPQMPSSAVPSTDAGHLPEDATNPQPTIVVPSPEASGEQVGSAEAASAQAAGQASSTITLNGWTIGLIIGLVLAAAAAITALLRRKVPVAGAAAKRVASSGVPTKKP